MPNYQLLDDLDPADCPECQRLKGRRCEAHSDPNLPCNSSLRAEEVSKVLDGGKHVLGNRIQAEGWAG